MIRRASPRKSCSTTSWSPRNTSAACVKEITMATTLAWRRPTIALIGAALVATLPAVSGLLVAQSSTGIAARYPGDVGIDGDPAVIFVENFEEPAMNDVFTRWGDVKNGSA